MRARVTQQRCDALPSSEKLPVLRHQCALETQRVLLSALVGRYVRTASELRQIAAHGHYMPAFDAVIVDDLDLLLPSCVSWRASIPCCWPHMRALRTSK